MFRVSQLDITISRGDTADLTIGLDGAEDGDTVVLTVKKDPASQALIEKTALADDGQAIFYFQSADTQDLSFGTYLWDLRIFGGNGDVTTPFRPKKFCVVEVVGNDRNG